MVGGHRLDPVVLAHDRFAGLHLDRIDRERQPSEQPLQVVHEAVQADWPDHRQRRFPPAQRECLQHSRQPEHVVGVEVREQDQVDVGQAEPRPQQLPLGALPAVDQDPLAAVTDQRGGRRPVRCRHCTRGAKEDDVQIHAQMVRGRAGRHRRLCASAFRAMTRRCLPIMRSRSSTPSSVRPDRIFATSTVAPRSPVRETEPHGAPAGLRHARTPPSRRVHGPETCPAERPVRRGRRIPTTRSCGAAGGGSSGG